MGLSPSNFPQAQQRQDTTNHPTLFPRKSVAKVTPHLHVSRKPHGSAVARAEAGTREPAHDGNNPSNETAVPILDVHARRRRSRRGHDRLTYKRERHGRQGFISLHRTTFSARILSWGSCSVSQAISSHAVVIHVRTTATNLGRRLTPQCPIGTVFPKCGGVGGGGGRGSESHHVQYCLSLTPQK